MVTFFMECGFSQMVNSGIMGMADGLTGGIKVVLTGMQDMYDSIE
ncbi:hypothetical protein BLGI_5055 [Brevibacillus laterosporus GI-9]|nr:hypothetical protein BLGI_5055 [Brevibacillus laterosporus GI-9]